ncbi:MAG: sarcosine oxidase subunit beta [Paracoccaceae bacterium]
MTGVGTSLPDVVIVGAGITGCATALALAEAGAQVMVIERYRPAAMASGWTLAGVRQSGRDPAELPLARAAVEIWQTLDARLDTPTGYRQRGNLRLARTDDEAKVIDDLVTSQTAAGLPMELLNCQAAREIAPALAESILCASWCPSDGHADPIASVEGFRRAAERLGVIFRTGLQVTGVTTEKAQFASLDTTDGPIFAGTALLAAGVQTNALLDGLGLRIPMTLPMVSVLQSAPLPMSLGPVIGVANADLAVRQQIDGRLRFTGGADHAGAELDLSGEQPAVYPPAASLARTISLVCKILPMVAPAPIARVWGGLLDLTPDALPVLDRVPDIEGLFVAAGFSGHGFGIGPAVGQALAKLVLGAETDIPLDAFAFDRFGDRPETEATGTLTLHG